MTDERTIAAPVAGRIDAPYFYLDHLTVGYDGVPVIKDIQIGIERGEIVTLIGPNGAGKSTILKSITRQLEVIDGRVVFDGEDLHKMTFRDMSSRIAVVLTERMKPELMTCHDIVATGRYPYTGRLGLLTREDEAKVDAAMAAVHASELGDRDFMSISDGQRQRVLLARAICQEPDVIILDEPTSFLDVRHKLELLAILRRMAKSQGITVIMSLHEIDLAMKVSDKIACVKGDCIQRYGEPESVFDEAAIRDLYSIDNGYFDPVFGSIELPRVEGGPKVLVVSSGGAGVSTMRRLQKTDTPFAIGPLRRGDVDWQLARLLAVEVVEAPACEPVDDAACERLHQLVDACDKVVDAGACTSGINARVAEVLEYARSQGKLTTNTKL